MKFVINGKFLSQRTTGVQRYARELLSALDLLSPQLDLVLAVPEDAKNVPDFTTIRTVVVPGGRGIRWEQLSFPRFVKKEKGISINLANVAPLTRPDVVCIHDVKIKATPEFFSRKFLLWYNLLFWNETRRAKAILTVSEFSKGEIERYYPKAKGKIHVVYNAWNHCSKVSYDENALLKYRLEKGKYYFSMSSLEPNKNFRWIAEEANRHPEKVFAVAGSINEDVFSEGLGFPCPKNMRLLGFVRDEEAMTLLRDAEAFLFPSFYEGFGIPPLEAMAAGAKRIFVSDIPVMHEVFGDSVAYIDPKSHEKDMGNMDYGTGLFQSVLDRFSWKKSAEELLSLLENMEQCADR